MKKIFTLSTALLLVGSIFSQGTSVSFCDDFDSYQNGDPIAETSSDWETWGSITSPTPPYIDDANVSNVLANSGSNSLYLFSGASQGNQDVVLPFGIGTPYTTGSFEFTANFYVNQNTGAYFNFQADNIPGTTWSLDVKMDLGNIVLENTGSGINYLNSTYPENQWFELKIFVDLSDNIWSLYIDNSWKGSFTNTTNQIASLDLYPIIGHEFYVDDVCYTYDSTPIILDNLNLALSTINSISGLDGQLRNPVVNVINLGYTNITSFDVDFDYNGNTITENITGVNLITVGTHQVNFTNNITLLGGSNVAISNIYNINGMNDDNPFDDTNSIQINAIIPAAGKLVIGEEATGTWCGWCPRGAVALNWMDNDYEGYWQGIAVHNGDPMTDAYYDNGMAPYIGGYPSGIVDRGQDINPAAFKQDFLQRIVIPPSGIITNGAELNGDTLMVSLTVDFQNSISGNYKLACILVEDSVTGTTPQYYQSNSYSGGGAGPLIDVDGSDWANKPSSVPASQMVYRHVARGIAPSFAGEPLSATSYNSGDSETICYKLLLDPSWDQSQISIVGMLLDNSNVTDNGSSTSLTDAITVGFDASACSIFVEIPSWDCDPSTGACFDPGVGSGAYSTATACQAACVAPSWDCDPSTGTCFDPGTGSGTYTSSAACQAACVVSAINEEISHLLIYPNPATDNIYISNIKERSVIVKIYDVSGRLVLENKVSNKEYLNISTLSKGMYQIKFEGNNLNETRKLIIE